MNNKYKNKFKKTTGLDPINKRSVWQLIKKLKKDRIIILTTHSMDEANFLSDQTAILSHGQLKFFFLFK